MWTASLLYVLERAGFKEQAARQAIARGVAAGWMVSERQGTRDPLPPDAGAGGALRRGRQSGVRLQPRSRAVGGRWLISHLDSERAAAGPQRLYTALSWAGLGNPTPGLWLTPHSDRLGEVERVIAELGLRESTVSVIGAPAAAGLSEAEIVRRAWDLDSVAARYEELLARFRGLEPDPGTRCCSRTSS